MSRIDSLSECVIFAMESGAVVSGPTATAKSFRWGFSESQGTQLPPNLSSFVDWGEIT